MLVRFGFTAFNAIAIFIQSRPQHNIWGQMKLIEITGNQFTLGIILRAQTNSAARRNTSFGFFLGAEISTPCAPF